MDERTEIPPCSEWTVGAFDQPRTRAEQELFEEIASHNQAILDGAIRDEQEATAEALLDGRGCSLLEARRHLEPEG
jgi:hypothetical protein